MRSRAFLNGLFAFSLALLPTAVPVRAQTYLNAVGNPSFGVNLPIPNGYVNISNGNVHLEIPLSNAKQRGALSLSEKLVYDSRIWKIVHYSGYYWWPINVPNSQLGWRFVKGNETGTIGTSTGATQNASCWTGNYYQPYYSATTYYTWTDPAGTVHPFSASSTSTTYPSNCPGVQPGTVTTTTNGWATDASGYFATTSSDALGNVTVTVKDNSGTQVYPQVVDRYGNFWSSDANGNLVDDRGQTPVIVTSNGNVTYYDVLAPNGPITNNGKRVRYTITTTQVSLTTAFNQQAVSEYQNNGTHPTSYPAIQSIALPDGSSYTFTYDNYGMITSMVLPTGGTVGLGWTNYTDSYQNVNRWITSSTIAGSTTQYTPSVVTQCSGNGTGCQEKVNVHRPSGDESVYTLTLNNGAWDTNVTVYQGAASSNQAKLAVVNAYDFSQPCTTGCSGAQNVTKTTETDTLPDANLSTQVQTTFASTTTGKPLTWAKWEYYPSSSSPSGNATRSITYQYTNYDLTQETHLDATGNTASLTTYTYGSSATSVPGLVGHGSANAGGPYLASVVATNNAPSGTSTVNMSYEDNGSLLSMQDANGNPATTYKYDSTHTFVTEVDKPSTTSGSTSITHVSKSGYDGTSGALLWTCDENCVATGQTATVQYAYEPVAGRLQSVTYPKAVPTDTANGSTTYAYPSVNEVDTTVAQTASVNTTTTQTVDGYGRPIETSTGGIVSTTTYDGNGRPYATTTPTSGAASTNGTSYTYYDTLDRVTSVLFPDGNSRSVQLVGNTVLSIDELGNLTRQIFNGFGEIISVVEPDPTTGTLSLETDYQRDGLGNVTCIEQHGNVTGTGCSASPSSDSTSAWRVRRFFYNSLSQLRAASIPEHTNGAATRLSCGQGTGGTQWTDCYSYDANGNLTKAMDIRGYPRNFGYDALNRKTLEYYADLSTRAWSYDTATNGVGRLASISNGMNTISASYSYDALGRLTTEKDCRQTGYCGQASATYDLAGNQTSLTYPDARVIGAGYDGLNRLSTVTYQQWGANAVNTSYWSGPSYGAPGVLQGATYGNGVQMKAAFNSRLSLTNLSYQTGSSTPTLLSNKTYAWDKNAVNLLSITDSVASKQRQFGYDKLNRLSSARDYTATAVQATGTATVTGVDGYTQPCGGGGNPNAATPNAHTAQPAATPGCNIVWDTGNLYLTIGNFTASAAYAKGTTDAGLASKLASQLNTSGIVTATTSGATITITAVSSGPGGDYAMSWSTDQDFNIDLSGSAMTGGVAATPLSGGLNQQYSLDAWGNLSSMGSSGFNQPVNLANQVSTFSYDTAGRLTSDGVQTYTYDDDNRLLTASSGVSVGYDPQGARAQVTTSSGTKEYYFFGGALIATRNASSGAWTDMIYAGGQRIAYSAGSQTALPTYLLPDHLGSQSATTDAGGNVLTTLDTAPFGQVFSGAGADNFLFTGLERDPSGLDDAEFREYSSATARWLTPDPYDGSYDLTNPQSLNRYAYVAGKPLYFVDPSGRLGVCSSVGYVGGVYTLTCSAIEFTGDAICGPVCGTVLGSLALAAEALLPGFFAPQFHGSLKPRPQARNPCASSALEKAGTTAQQQLKNVATAKASGAAVGGVAGLPLGDVGSFLGSKIGSVYGFYQAVRTGGINDIKAQPGPGQGASNQIGIDAGNVSYGVTCSYGETVCQAAAGLNQTYRAYNGQGTYGSLRTYGDSPSDNASIRIGQEMRAAGCHE